MGDNSVIGFSFACMLIGIAGITLSMIRGR